jgi:hypothetical protein
MGSNKGVAGSTAPPRRGPGRAPKPPIALDPLKAKDKTNRPINGPPIIHIGMKGLMMVLQVTDTQRLYNAFV